MIPGTPELVDRSNESDISAIRMWGYSPDFKAKKVDTNSVNPTSLDFID
jgi:hypothetical protein